MGWRIVKQPNGRYARFSEVVDDFTIWNCSREEIVEETLKAAREEALRLAEEKLRGADQDFSKHEGGRWAEALQMIKQHHGKQHLDEFLAEYEKAKDEK